MTAGEASHRGNQWASAVVGTITKEDLIAKAFPNGVPEGLSDQLAIGDAELMNVLDEAWFKMAETKIYAAKEEEDWADLLEYIQRRSRNGEELELLQDEIGYAIYAAVELTGQNIIETI